MNEPECTCTIIERMGPINVTKTNQLCPIHGTKIPIELLPPERGTLSFRDQAAIAAMQAIVAAEYASPDTCGSEEDIAIYAMDLADELAAERLKRGEETGRT